RIPDAAVRGRTGARRLADRRLIDFEHAADLFPAVNGLAALPAQLRAATAAERAAQVVVQHIAGERRLARSRNAGDDHEPAERQAERLPAQVVHRRGFDLERSRASADYAPLRDRMTQRLREQSPGDRLRRAPQFAPP